MSKKKKQPTEAAPPKKKGGGFTRFLLFMIVVGGLGGGAYIYLNPQTDPSIKVAISFYNHLQSKNYDQAINMFDKNMFKQRTKEEWAAWLKQRDEQYKGINGYKLNQVSKLSDSQNSKRLIYSSVQYGDSTRYEQIHFLQVGDQYKVLDYLTKRSKEETDRNTSLN